MKHHTAPKSVQNSNGRESAQRIYSDIRRRILSGEMVGGSVVSQVKIAQEFDVSRSPVREALRMLENEGLIDAQTNQRGRVATFSAADMEQVCAILMVNVAAAVVAGSGRFTSEDRAAIEQTIDQLDGVLAAGESASANREERAKRARQVAFRKLITQLCRHAGGRAVALIDGLLDRIAMFRQLHESGHGRTPYPLDPDFSRLRQSVKGDNSIAAGQELVAKINEVSTKALLFVDPNYRPFLLDTYARSAAGIFARPNDLAGGEKLTITIRTDTTAGLQYNVEKQ